MLQAVITLEDFRAELHHRAERCRIHRPFGKTHGTFTGPAQGRAVETQPPQGESTMQLTTTTERTMQKAGEDAALNLITEFCNPGDTPPGEVMAASIVDAFRAAGLDDAERAWLAGFCSIIGSMFADYCNSHQFTVTESEGGEA